jgi:flavin reductase (DIM6/NTAB) family NADH-FMN oxidoreductase RutF
MAIEKGFFRQVMGRFATGVTVVTTKSQGTLAGLTVNAFCSVSLNPPLVLICVDLVSATLPVIRESGIFAVNILTDKQEYLSRCFATSSAERYERFCSASYHVAATGAPIIDDTLAFIDARVVAEYPGGDHVIFLGQVEAMGVGSQVAFAHEEDREHSTVAEYGSNGTEKVPLAYYLGQYRHLASDYQKPSLAPPTVHAQKNG